MRESKEKLTNRKKRKLINGQSLGCFLGYEVKENVLLVRTERGIIRIIACNDAVVRIQAGRNGEFLEPLAKPYNEKEWHCQSFRVLNKEREVLVESSTFRFTLNKEDIFFRSRNVNIEPPLFSKEEWKVCLSKKERERIYGFGHSMHSFESSTIHLVCTQTYMILTSTS